MFGVEDGGTEVTIGTGGACVIGGGSVSVGLSTGIGSIVEEEDGAIGVAVVLLLFFLEPFLLFLVLLVGPAAAIE